MKKVVRTVCIGALSGLAFLAACCSSKGLTRAEKKQLKHDRDSIQQNLDIHWMSTPENDLVARAEFEMESNRLQYQIDSIDYRLGKNVDLEQSKQLLEQSKQILEQSKQEAMKIKQTMGLRQRIEELKEALRMREGACIYGSPEVMKEYGKKTQEMRDELNELEKQLEETNK